jgi:hypothetical protein
MSTILVIVLTLLLLLLSAALHAATAASFTAVKSGAWSDQSTWGLSRGGDDEARAPPRLPSPGDHVVIAANTRVVFDGVDPGTASSSSAVRVASVNIQRGAVLSCPRSSAPARKPLILELALLRIEGGGCFSCGYGDCTRDAEPYAGKFTLRLRSAIPPQTADENTRTLVVENGGALYLSGAPRRRPVVRLDADADVGTTRLMISGAEGVDIAAAAADATNGDAGQQQQPQQPWKVGDRVAIAPTDFDPAQTEYHTIIGVYSTGRPGQARSSSYILEVADALKYARSGRVFQFTNRADNNRVVTLDTRAEIALLSRNVVIEGTDDAVDGLGGDLMMVGANGRARLSWVEIRNMGRRGHLGRYPLHIHNLGDGGRNVFVSNVAIHSSYQRGIVIHCTNGVNLINNTVAGTFGFGYMLEDGAEQGNILIGNYAIDIRPAGTKLLTKPLIQTERVNPAGFWFVNMANTWQGNVAAGVAGAGFSMDMDAVLADRPATLTTCPDALPRWWSGGGGGDYSSSRWKGIDKGPGDKQGNATAITEFNKAVYTALMRKRFVKFEDNVAHATFSGLWMTYPFMDADDMMDTTSQKTAAAAHQQVDVEGFTAWKIGFRSLTTDDTLSDGITLLFEACVHMRDPRRMQIHRLTCLNAERVAWSSLAAYFDGTTFGWLSDRELKPSNGRSSDKENRPAGGAFLSYMEPHTFVRTHFIVGGGGRSSEAGVVAFATAFQGQRMAPLNVLHELSIETRLGPSPSLQPPKQGTVAAVAAFASTTPLIALNAGDCHVYTDEIGDAFGAGPGAMVAASCPGCPGVDPLVEAHARGKCAAAAAMGAPTTGLAISSTSEARGRLPNGAVVAAKSGAVPMLCYGVGGDLRFVVLDLVFFRDGGNPLRSIQMEALGPAGQRIQGSLRSIKSFPLLLPLTSDSMDGGYRIDAGAGEFEYFDVSFGPTTRPDDAMTIVIASPDDAAEFIAVPSPGTTAVSSSMSPPKGGFGIKDGGVACGFTTSPNNNRVSCPSDDPASGLEKRASSPQLLPRVCICHASDDGGGGGRQLLVLRFSAGSQPQYRGLYAADGSERPTYSLGSVRVLHRGTA